MTDTAPNRGKLRPCIGACSNLASILSLLLCAAAVVFWVRSETRGDEAWATFGRAFFDWNSSGGRFRVEAGYDFPTREPPRWATIADGTTPAVWPPQRFQDEDAHVSFSFDRAGVQFSCGRENVCLDAGGRIVPISERLYDVPVSADVAFPYASVGVPYWQVVLAALLLPGLTALRYARSCSRARRNKCCACGYNLTGNTSGVCPECGMRFSRERLLHRPTA